MYATEIHTSRAWLTLATDPADNPLVVGTQRPTDATLQQDGEVRIYAGGRRQSVSYPPVARTVPVTLIGLSPAQKALVESRIGVTCLFRSVIGERFYCTYLVSNTHAVQTGTTLNDGRGYHMALTLYEVDYDESVDP